MFKNIFVLTCIAIFIFSCSISSLKQLQKNSFTETRDEGHDGNAKILTGSFTRDILQKDTAFKWFNDNYKYANPDASAVTTFKNKKDKFSVVVFGGTWCHDTQNLLPLFFKLIDQSEFPANKIYLIGVDRAKTTIKQLHTKYKVVNVPTFIIQDNTGKEFGRVVEYGNTGAIDKELAQIVNSIQ